MNDCLKKVFNIDKPKVILNMSQLIVIAFHPNKQFSVNFTTLLDLKKEIDSQMPNLNIDISIVFSGMNLTDNSAALVSLGIMNRSTIFL